MKQATKDLSEKVDYINTHGTSTPIGDIKEIEAMKTMYKTDMPFFSSTKSLTGHSLGGTGVQEAIYSILMMKNDFICKSANIDNLDSEVEDVEEFEKPTDSIPEEKISVSIEQLRKKMSDKDES